MGMRPIALARRKQPGRTGSCPSTWEV